MSGQTASQLQSFKVEYRLGADELPLPALGAELADAVASGTTEIRRQVQYDAPASRLTSWTFTVLDSSPAVTSMVDLQNATIEKFHVSVNQISVSGRDVSFSGIVEPGASAYLLPISEGIPVTLKATYSGAQVARFTGAQFLVAGINVEFPHEGAGSVEFSDKPNRPPVLVVNQDFDTTQAEVMLDASGSSDPDGDALDFKWHLISGAASLRGCETPTPVFMFRSGRGVYQFIVTVTDSRGAAVEKIINVSYYGH